MITEFVGWAIVHSLWQGALIAIAAAIVFSLMQGSRASSRHTVGLVALASMVVLPVLTSMDISRPGTTSGGAPNVVPGYSTPTPVINPDILTRTDRVVVPAPKPVEAPHFRITSGGTTLPRRVIGESRFQSVERAIPFIAIAWVIGLFMASLRSILTRSRSRIPAVAGASGFREFLTTLFQSFAATLLYHNPAARWLVRRIRQEAERTYTDVPAAADGKFRRFQFVPRLAAGIITITTGLLAGQQAMGSVTASMANYFRIAQERSASVTEHEPMQTVARAEPDQSSRDVESESDDADDRDEQEDQGDQNDQNDRGIRIDRGNRGEVERAVQSIVIRRALEALSQVDGDRGIAALEEIARSSQNREIRRRARQILRDRGGDM